MNVDVRQPVHNLLIQDPRQGMNIGDGTSFPRVLDLISIKLEKPSFISVFLRTIFIASIVFSCFYFTYIFASCIVLIITLSFIPVMDILKIADKIFNLRKNNDQFLSNT